MGRGKAAKHCLFLPGRGWKVNYFLDPTEPETTGYGDWSIVPCFRAELNGQLPARPVETSRVGKDKVCLFLYHQCLAGVIWVLPKRFS